MSAAERRRMRGRVAIVGAAESDELGKLPHKSALALHAEAGRNALADAGLTKKDVDGVFSAGLWMAAETAEYMGIRPRYLDGTQIGGCSFIAQVEHAMAALDAGLCDVALVTHGESGASRVGIFWWLALPLSIPGLVTVGVLAFVASWNAYLLPLLLLQEEMRTLPLGVADYSTEHSADTAGVLAFTTLAMIPALVMFLAMQRRIVSGLQGAVKG